MHTDRHAHACALTKNTRARACKPKRKTVITHAHLLRKPRFILTPFMPIECVKFGDGGGTAPTQSCKLVDSYIRDTGNTVRFLYLLIKS